MRTAVTVMYAGAAVSAASLITSLACLGYLIGAKDAIRNAHPSLIGMGSCSAGHCRAAEVHTVIVQAVIVPGVVVIALRLRMAQHNGQGRNGARTVSTVLFALAALELTAATTGTGIVVGATVPGVIVRLTAIPARLAPSTRSLNQAGTRAAGDRAG